MGIKEKIGATIATKYGTVIEGKHKGTVVALGIGSGDEASTKVEFVDGFNQIVFFDGTKEKARYGIDKNFGLAAINILEKTDNGIKVKAAFNDEQYFIFELEWKKEDSFIVDLIKKLLGFKKVDESKTEKAESKYRPIKVFMGAFYTKLSPETAQFLLSFYEKHNILDDSNRKLLNSLIEIHQKA